MVQLLNSSRPRELFDHSGREQHGSGRASHHRWMTRRTPLPEGLPLEGFAVDDALSRGATRAQLRSADLTSPFWGVRVVRGISDESLASAAAYLARSPQPAIVSHVSAAKLWGIPLPPRWQRDERLHVSVPPDVRAPKGARVAGHHVALHPADVTIRSGLRTTTQSRTVCDLAGLLSEEDLLAATDFLLWWRREDERVPKEDIQRAINRHPTKRGMSRMRKIAALASDRADSAPESKLRYRIVEAGFPHPSVNVELFDSRGQFLAMPDLCYPSFMMCFDYEGDHHRTEAGQWEKDIHRVPRLQDAGWHHTRVSKSDLGDSHDFLTRLARNLRARGWTP